MNKKILFVVAPEQLNEVETNKNVLFAVPKQLNEEETNKKVLFAVPKQSNPEVECPIDYPAWIARCYRESVEKKGIKFENSPSGNDEFVVTVENSRKFEHNFHFKSFPNGPKVHDWHTYIRHNIKGGVYRYNFYDEHPCEETPEVYELLKNEPEHEPQCNWEIYSKTTDCSLYFNYNVKVLEYYLKTLDPDRGTRYHHWKVRNKWVDVPYTYPEYRNAAEEVAYIIDEAFFFVRRTLNIPSYGAVTDNDIYRNYIGDEATRDMTFVLYDYDELSKDDPHMLIEFRGDWTNRVTYDHSEPFMVDVSEKPDFAELELMGDASAIANLRYCEHIQEFKITDSWKNNIIVEWDGVPGVKVHIKTKQKRIDKMREELKI